MEETAAPAPAPRSIGVRLRAGRERAGLSVAAAAEKLHLDPKVIEALEADRFAELGASVYVRGHLRRYADFVGEAGAEMVNAYGARQVSPPPPDLTRIPQVERHTDPRRLITPLVGLGCALVIALAIWWVLSGSHGGGAKPSDQTSAAAPAGAAPASSSTPITATSMPVSNSPAMRGADVVPTSAANNASAAVPTDAVNVARRDTSSEAASAPVRATRLRLELASESWVEVYDSRGERLFYDVASAGSVQSIEGRAPLRVVLGNAAAVAVQVDGQPRQIPAAAVDGEGAHFVVNRSGSLARSRQ
jgi:cytoskeleton protein RodZ